MPACFEEVILGLANGCGRIADVVYVVNMIVDIKWISYRAGKGLAVCREALVFAEVIEVRLHRSLVVV